MKPLNGTCNMIPIGIFLESTVAHRPHSLSLGNFVAKMIKKGTMNNKNKIGKRNSCYSNQSCQFYSGATRSDRNVPDLAKIGTKYP